MKCIYLSRKHVHPSYLLDDGNACLLMPAALSAQDDKQQSLSLF